MWISFRVQKRILSILTMEKCLLARKVIQFYVYCTHPEAQVKLSVLKQEFCFQCGNNIEIIKDNKRKPFSLQLHRNTQNHGTTFMGHFCPQDVGENLLSVLISHAIGTRCLQRNFHSTFKHLARPTSLSKLLTEFIYPN